MSVQSLKITRIAETQLSIDPYTDEPNMSQWLTPDLLGSEAAAVSEMAGRSCYQSFDRPNPSTATAAGYVANIINIKHFSVLCHAQVTYYIEGVSRSLTHELVRHRWPAYSQLSQRYVKIADSLPYVIPPLVRDREKLERLLQEASDYAVAAYENLVREIQSELPEASRKQVREAARAVLPNMTETKIVISANLRAWRDLLEQRLDANADAEIRELARLLLDDLRDYAPEVFADLARFR